MSSRGSLLFVFDAQPTQNRCVSRRFQLLDELGAAGFHDASFDHHVHLVRSKDASWNPAAPSSSRSWNLRDTHRFCVGWASKTKRRLPRLLMAVKAQDLTKDYKYGFSDPE